MCADLKAVVRTCPFAILTYDTTGGSVAFGSYLAMHGEGEGVSPTITRIDTGECTIEWEAAYTDDYNGVHGVQLRSAEVTCHGSTGARATVAIESPRLVRVRRWLKSTKAENDGRVTLVVY